MDLTVDIVIDKALMGQVEANVPKSSLLSTFPQNVKEMVDSINKFAGTNKIKVLRIWSHGWTHYPDDRDYPNGNIVVGVDNIRLETFENHRQELSKLKLSFAKSARVELRGCSPAKGNGKEMMIKLAQLLEVEIHGSTKTQELIFWKPPVFAANPSGSFDKLLNPIEVY